MKLSPVWDEVMYPAAGYYQLKTGSAAGGTETVHPFLAKVLYGAPWLLVCPDLPADADESVRQDPYRFGFEILFKNPSQSKTLIFLSRIPVMIFSLLTLWLLSIWTKEIWGPWGAVATTWTYTTIPILLSRASLCLLDTPVYFFTVLALFAQWKSWTSGSSKKWFLMAGISTGAAVLCKLAALPLWTTIFFAELLVAPRLFNAKARFFRAGLLILTAMVTVVGLTLPWRHGGDAIKNMATFLINFKNGQWDFFYWAGETLKAAPSPLTWAAFFVKAPPFQWMAGIFGALLWIRSRHSRPVWGQWVCLLAFTLATPLFTTHAMYQGELSLVYLSVAALAAGLAEGPRVSKKGITGLLLALIPFGSVDTLRSRPNFLAYFSPLVGGPPLGYHWLDNSDQDWGQGLPNLARFLRKNGNPALILSYSGAADPRAYDIQYQDFLSPALVTGVKPLWVIPENTEKIYLAVGTKVVQTEPYYLSWLLKNRKPHWVVDSVFWVYDISNDAESHRWLGTVYERTRRPVLARWAFTRALALGGDPQFDRNALAELDKKFNTPGLLPEN